MRFQNIFKQKCTEMDKKIAITCYTELKNIEEISYRDLLYSVDSLIFNLTNIGMKSGMRIIIIEQQRKLLRQENVQPEDLKHWVLSVLNPDLTLFLQDMAG